MIDKVIEMIVDSANEAFKLAIILNHIILSTYQILYNLKKVIYITIHKHDT